MNDEGHSQTEDPIVTPDGSSIGEHDMTVVSSTPMMSESVPRNSSFTELAKLLEGQRLNHFQLLETIGGGGMGVVFRAVDTRLGRTVAVKVLSRYEAGDEDALNRFKNEAQSAARLDHVNIARVYFVGEDKGWHYIVFEYIDGVNVRDLVERDGPLSLADSVSFTLQIAEALSHASRRDVVHRDIKPSNVLITDERRAKLVDMGLARLHQVEHSSDDLTASGVTLGTFDYISPEQARDPRAADVRSDVYSLGCTLFFMLAGRPPFPEGTVLQKLLKHQSEAPPELRQIRPDAPAELLAVAEKMLSKNPDDRYQDAPSLIADLYALAEKLGIRTGSSASIAIVRRSKPTSSAWTKHLPWALPVATLAFAVVLLEVFWSARAESTPPPPPVIGNSDVVQVSEEEDLTPPPTADASPLELESGGELEQPKAGTESGDEASFRLPSMESDLAPETPKKPTEEDSGKKDATSRKPTSDDKPPSDDGKAPKEEEGSDVQGELPSVDKGDSDPKPVDPRKARHSLLIVADKYEGESTYATLRKACAVAKNGDVIELRYSGPRIEQPIRIKNRQITIRAGRNINGTTFKPQIVFRPDESRLAEFENGMFALEDGASLRLQGVHVVLDPGEIAAQQWSLVSLMGAKGVDARDCWFTIRNAASNKEAYHRDVAFFHAKADPKRSVMKMVDPTMAERSMSVDLANCVVRGEARVLQVDELELVELSWRNGLCATTEPLLFAQGGKVDVGPASSPSRIELRHVTALLGGGLCEFPSPKGSPYQRIWDVYCVDSILAGRAEAVFVKQAGFADVDRLKERFRYTGERVFYERFNDFWRIQNRSGENVEAEELGFAEWKKHWEGSDLGNEQFPQANEVLWRQRPTFARITHNQNLGNFVLEGSLQNPAKGGGEGGASDGLDSGAILESLSDFADPEPEAEDAEDVGRPREDGPAIP